MKTIEAQTGEPILVDDESYLLYYKYKWQVTGFHFSPNFISA